jgi:phytoene dehydrogenase-like protein
MRIIMKGPKKRVIVAGAGISGLTAGAYILRGGHELLILEKSAKRGGLVNSFSRDGFLFDTGPRAIGNAGILSPMLEDLGIDLPSVKGEVSTGIRDLIVHYDGEKGVEDFLLSLRRLFPARIGEIRSIEARVRSSMRMAAMLNRVPNPFFKDVFRDKGFFFKEFLPLMPAFLSTVIRMGLADESIETALASISADRSLNDMVSQHFFKGTPASFAFGYFENFRDYLYPLGGTVRLPEALARLIESKGGHILTNTEIVKIHPAGKTVVDRQGSEYAYDSLLWCADLKALYERIDPEGLSPRVGRSIQKEKMKYSSAKAGESVFTLFLAVDEAPESFGKISKGHFIYTPRMEGLGDLRRGALARIKADFEGTSKPELFHWLKDFCRFNSYEISIPALKDPSLAPKDKTGLVVSLLFDGELFRLVEKAGWYEEFKHEAAEAMLDALEESVYPGLRGKILFRESATPLTLMKAFNTTEGAITGWSMEERPPVPSSLAGVTATPRTAVPCVYKAGQWSYSPSGVPVAILTGRIAAKAILDAARSS